MDTRTKIMRLEAWSPGAGEEWTVVAGVFDPFTLEAANVVTRHARPGTKLAVTVVSGSETLLSQEARASLLASLARVDAVFAGAEQVEQVLERARQCGAQAQLADERPGDGRRSRAFVRFVVERQQSAAAVRGADGKRGG